MSDRTPNALPKRMTTLAAAAALAALAIWAMWKLAAFTLSVVVQTSTGAMDVVSTYPSVDHPFHATRSALLLKSLQDGKILRWVASHQGGYPVEFYPLGVAWMDVGLWALLLGQAPIIAVHKLTVALIFVLPAAGFWILARGDRANPFVPVLALAIHVAVPGEWTQGGKTELVYWGLVANVGGAIFALVMMAALARWVREGNRCYGVLAIFACTAALYTNTRSSIAIVVATLAIASVALVERRDEWRAALQEVAVRIGLVAVLSVLLTAPLLLSMARYVDLYFFMHFMEYDNLNEIWKASRNTLGQVFGGLAIGGAIASLALRRHKYAAIVAATLVGYLASIVGFSLNDTLAGTIQQLETPRLMPFMRYLAVYLAAWFVAWLVQELATRAKLSSATWFVAGTVMLAAVATLLIFYGPFVEFEEPYAQPPVWTTASQEFVDFEQGVSTVDQLHPEGTAIFIVGDQMSWWHEQLWAPVWSDEMFFYDDWMWYWHPDHEGPYDPAQGHAYLDPARAFVPEWFSAHGVGAVMVTNMPELGLKDPRTAAQTNPHLQFQQTVGNWDIYLVNAPGSIVTNGTTPATSATVSNHNISASFEDASGDVEIRRNWFPRWQASADGKPVEIDRTENGYMTVTVPDGTTSVELHYGVNAIDWLGRVAAVFGLMATVAFAVPWPKTSFETHSRKGSA